MLKRRMMPSSRIVLPKGAALLPSPTCERNGLKAHGMLVSDSPSCCWTHFTRQATGEVRPPSPSLSAALRARAKETFTGGHPTGTGAPAGLVKRHTCRYAPGWLRSLHNLARHPRGSVHWRHVAVAMRQPGLRCPLRLPWSRT